MPNDYYSVQQKIEILSKTNNKGSALYNSNRIKKFCKLTKKTIASGYRKRK